MMKKMDVWEARMRRFKKMDVWEARMRRFSFRDQSQPYKGPRMDVSP
jgi:hypothetical protein